MSDEEDIESCSTAGPAHPGDMIHKEYMRIPRVCPEEMARALLVEPAVVTDLLRGRISVTADMAFRLARALDTHPRLWLKMQHRYDLWTLKSLKLRDYLGVTRPRRTR